MLLDIKEPVQSLLVNASEHSTADGGTQFLLVVGRSGHLVQLWADCGSSNGTFSGHCFREWRSL